MKVQDVHIGKQLKVVSNLPTGTPGLQDQVYGLGPTAVPGTIWAEGGVLVGSPLNYPIPNVPEASLMVGRAPLTNPLAKVAVSILKVTNKGGLSPIDKINPLDIWLGDPGVGVVGITINSSIINIVNATAINIATPTLNITGIKNQAGAQNDVGAQTEAGAQAEAGAEARSSKKCIAGTQVNMGSIKATGLIQASAFKGNGRLLTNLPCKSFDISHPLKENQRLRHVCVEAPTADVYIRGKLDGNHIINLPDYWKGLVDHETITVNLTPIGKADVSLHVGEIREDKIILSSDHLTQVKCFYHVYAERKDVEKNIPEYEGSSPADYPGDNTQYSIAGYNYDRRD